MTTDADFLILFFSVDKYMYINAYYFQMKMLGRCILKYAYTAKMPIIIFTAIVKLDVIYEIPCSPLKVLPAPLVPKT